LGSAAASVEFTSISGSFTDLLIVARAQHTLTNHTTFQMTFNSDTGSNYSVTRLYGNGSSASSDRFSSQTSIDAGYMPPDTGGIGTFFVNIMSYANTNVFTTVLGSWETQAGTSGNQYVVRQVGLWRSTNAITSVKFVPESVGNTIASGSTFSLYGIKAA
jgi:hypothetical protein